MYIAQSPVEEIISKAYQWWTAGLLSSIVIFGAIFLLILYFGWRIFKGLIVQMLLFIMSFVPCLITSYALNINSLQSNSVVPIEGPVYLLFPYVWDSMLGVFKDTSFGAVCVIFIFLSFIAFWHLALLFCHHWKINKLYSFPIAYLCVLAFGLGLFNFHVYLYELYVNYMNSIGLHPAIPPIFLVSIIIIIILLYLFVLKGKRKETITITPVEVKSD